MYRQSSDHLRHPRNRVNVRKNGLGEILIQLYPDRSHPVIRGIYNPEPVETDTTAFRHFVSVPGERKRGPGDICIG